MANISTDFSTWSATPASNQPDSADTATITADLQALQAALKIIFPNIGAALTPTHTELNYVNGVTSAIQTQLNAKAAQTQLNAKAASGANSDITSLSGLTTPLSQAQGGTGANTIPVFSAYQSSAQTLATATYTKITVDTEEYDTNNNFATSRFTCTVPGYYLFTAGITVGATRTEILPVLYKNGSAYRNFGEDTTASGSASGSMLIKLDATDYVEFYAYFAVGQVTTAGSLYTYFQGHLVKAT